MTARGGLDLIFFLAALAQAQTPARPDVVLIVTDNHGAWSISPTATATSARRTSTAWPRKASPSPARSPTTLCAPPREPHCSPA
jgi:hypothetical protein